MFQWSGATIKVYKIANIDFFKNLITLHLIFYMSRNYFIIFCFMKNVDIFSTMRFYTLSNRSIKAQTIEKYIGKLLSTFYTAMKICRQSDFENLHIYPTKNAMHVFLNEFVIRYIKLYQRSNYIAVIDNLQSTFSLKISRLQNVKNYLLLKYIKV